jgi:hypothetical protein
MNTTPPHALHPRSAPKTTQDYSDLPGEVLARHGRLEAARDAERERDAGEGGERAALAEADDARRRTRQERLHALRSGEVRPWALLHRGGARGRRL